MNTRQLECFVEVGRTGSFSKAALNLFLAQSSVTYQITQLELELSVPLFYRNTRNIEFTPEGERFFEDAKRILQMMNDSVNHLRGGTGMPRRKIVLLARHSEEDGIYKPALLAYSQMHPDVELQTKNAEHSYAQVSADLIVTSEKMSILHKYCAPDCCWTLRRIRAYANVLSSHPLADRASLTVDDIQDYPIIVTNPDIMGDLDWEIWDYIRSNKDKFNVLPIDRVSIMETNSRLYTIAGAVKLTVGRRVNFESSIVQIPFASDMTNLSINLGIVKGREDEEIRNFAAFLRKQYEGHDDC